jgi:hypothetical protein
MSPGLRSRRQVWNWRQPLRCRRTVSLVRYRGERSVGPAVNNAVAQCTAAAPPLLRSWHTRLARPGGGRGRCAQNPVMFTSYVHKWTDGAANIRLSDPIAFYLWS